MTRSARLAAVGLVVVTVGGGLAACSDDPDPGPTPSPSVATSSAPPTAPPTASPTASATPEPSASSPAATPTAAVPAGFAVTDVMSPRFPDLGGDLGGVGIVRVGRHSGYDRVVWEFPGAGLPTYRVRYVDTPIADGSGDVVAVTGAAFLEVLITFVGIPEEGVARPADPTASALSGTVIAEANAIFGGFEGYGQSFIGVRDRERPFKVSALAGPTRLVVDIATG